MWLILSCKFVSSKVLLLITSLRHSPRLQETRKTPKASAEVENPIWLPLNARFHQAKFS